MDERSSGQLWQQCCEKSVSSIKWSGNYKNCPFRYEAWCVCQLTGTRLPKRVVEGEKINGLRTHAHRGGIPQDKAVREDCCKKIFFCSQHNLATIEPE